MKSKPNEYVPSSQDSFEYKDQGTKHSLSKYEFDLYKEEDDIPNKLFRVKRVSLPNKGENWKLIEDNKVIDIIEGAKLSVKERNYLRGVDGTLFLIKYYKEQWKNFSTFKKHLKLAIKQ